MKHIIIIALTFICNSSLAQVIWPDTTAPCNTTLQTCVNESAFNETIELHSDNPISETIVITNGVSLVAGTGFKPTFTSGNSIIIDDNFGSSDITISGLSFSAGSIVYNGSGFDGNTQTVNIRNNYIQFSNNQSYAIGINNFSSLSLEINIEYNHIFFRAPTSPTERYGAIAINNGIYTGLTSTGNVTGRIYSNQINTHDDDSIGIGLYEHSENSSDLNISSNVLTGGDRAAIYVNKVAGSIGNSRLDFAHNAIYNNQDDPTLNGFKAVVRDGAIEINAINNSIIGASEGFSFQQITGGAYDINFYNNLITSTQTPVVINTPTNADTNVNISINNDNNLFHNNNSNDPDFIVGPNFMNTDPKLNGLQNGRLRPGSPAIEAGNGLFLFLIGDVPLIDADGLLRIKNGNPGSGGVTVDVGAYEAGDIRVLDVLKGNATNDNPIEAESISSNEFAKLQITQNWNPDTSGGGFSDHNIGVYRAGFAWRIFTQDQTAMPANATFNVWNPAPSANNFVHTASDAISASESFTELDHIGLNNNPDAILAITQLWDGLYNDNPVGVFYNPFTERWNIYNSNFVDMPWMAQFNVYYQPKSSNAFMHTVSDANSNLDATWIDHPLLNNTPCAQFQITYDSGIIFENRIGVFYSTFLEQWIILNQGSEPMPDNARFHVIISAEQIADCSDIIFADNFE